MTSAETNEPSFLGLVCLSSHLVIRKVNVFQEMDNAGTDTDSSGSVNVVVRCAFQTGSDIRVICPLSWTVMELKQHLHTVCTLHPVSF